MTSCTNQAYSVSRLFEQGSLLKAVYVNTTHRGLMVMTFGERAYDFMVESTK